LKLAILSTQLEGVTTQRSPKNRLLPWDDEASADTRVRRGQQVARPTRNMPGAPLRMPDLENDEGEFAGVRRQGTEEPGRGPWWRPATKWGRIFLGCGTLTVMGIVVTAGFVFKTYLERDARFRISGTGNIQTNGLGEVTRGDVLPVFGEDVGRNIFFVPLNDRRKQLEKIPWIEKATVMRVLPDQLRISVVERTPVALVRHGQQIGLVDANGVLLSMSASSMSKHHYSFPVVTGIDPGDPLSSRKARMAVYGRLISELDSTGQHLSQQISEIDLTDPEDARVVFMPEQGSDILAHFGDDQFLTRYQRYKAHIAEWRQQYPHLASVDLRYEQQVVLEMTPGAGGSQTTTDDGKPTSEKLRTAENKAPSKPSAGVRAAPSGKAAPHKAPAKPKSRKTREKSRASAPQKRNASINPNRQTATIEDEQGRTSRTG
jgi:cell division protein FtsQ